MLLVLGSAPAILAIHCERIRSKLISFCATTTFVRCICKEQEKQLLVSYTTNKTILVYIDNLSSRTKKETCIYRRGPQDGQNCCLIYPSFFYQSMCACVCVRACVWVLGGMCVCACLRASVRASVYVVYVCVRGREKLPFLTPGQPWRLYQGESERERKRVETVLHIGHSSQYQVR